MRTLRWATTGDPSCSSPAPTAAPLLFISRSHRRSPPVHLPLPPPLPSCSSPAPTAAPLLFISRSHRRSPPVHLPLPPPLPLLFVSRSHRRSPPVHLPLPPPLPSCSSPAPTAAPPPVHLPLPPPLPLLFISRSHRRAAPPICSPPDVPIGVDSVIPTQNTNVRGPNGARRVPRCNDEKVQPTRLI